MQSKMIWMALLTSLLLLTGGQTAVFAQASGWQASYWDNMTQSGAPILVQLEADENHTPHLDRDWGLARPHTPVPSDYFSARWERNHYFEPGRYRFTLTGDDGVRLWVNGELLIDQWQPQVASTFVGYIDLTAGVHQLRVDYYDQQHHARARLFWDRITATETAVAGPNWQPAVSGWRGEYYNNIFFYGVPSLVRNDPEINFDWGLNSPAFHEIPAELFAVRWTRTLTLVPGQYRFTTTSDDGVRLYVDGQLVINQWHTQTSLSHQAVVNVTQTAVPVVLEYFDDVGLAEARLTWARLDGGETAVVDAPLFASSSVVAEPGLVVPPTVGSATNSIAVPVRRGPGLQYAVFRSVPQNTAFTILGRDGVSMWLKVTLPDGAVGWVSTALADSPIPLTEQPVITCPTITGSC